MLVRLLIDYWKNVEEERGMNIIRLLIIVLHKIRKAQ